MQRDSNSSAQARYNEILAFALDQASSAVAPDAAALLAQFPGEQAIVRSVVADLEGYQRARAALATLAPTPRFALGARLGDFEIVGRIGLGGMGEVYRARQLSLGGRAVALKVLHSHVTDVASWTRFDREAHILANLHHPHLAEAYGLFACEGVRCLAMQLIDGPNLGEILAHLADRPELARDPRVVRHLIQRVAEVASALAVLHQAGLVHRDVKPENIVLGGGWGHEDPVPDVPAVLVDLGLARPIDVGTASRTDGTPASPSYAPPEQLLGEDLDATADVFSLGVTLHDLLSARRPSQRERAAHGLEPLRSLVPDVDQDLDSIVTRATEPHARWRHPDASVLLADLRAWLDGKPVPSRRLPIVKRLAQVARRHPWRVARFAILAPMLASVLWVGWEWRAATGRVTFAADSLDRGDVLAAREQIVRVAPWLLSVAAHAGEVSAFARRLARVAPADPLPRVLDALERGDSRAALQLAATQLARAGLASDPVLLRVLTHDLHSRGTIGSSSEAPLALCALARLLYERPPRSEEEDVALSGVRAALLARFEAADATEVERLWILTAFSGFAAPRDIDWMLDQALSQGVGSERQRLGLFAVERALRRVTLRGWSHELALDEICLRASAALREISVLFDAGDLRAEVVVAAFLEFTRAVAFLGRDRGEQVAVRAWLTELGFSPAPPTGRIDDGRFETSAALGEPWARDVLVNRSAWEPLRLRAARWGFGCGAFGDPATTEAARAVVPTSVREEFEAGHRRGEAQRRGEDPSAGLDPESLLVAAVDGANERELPAVKIPVSEQLAVPALVGDAGARLVASWNFETAEQVGLGGNALSARGRLANVQPDLGGYFLWLGVFGQSEVTLEFHTQHDASPFDLVLVLRQQAARRNYYPFEGQASLDVSLDGVSIADALLVTSSRSTGQAQSIGWNRLNGGEPGEAQSIHRISMRLHETSTTTHRIQEVSLWRRSKR